MRIVSTGCCAIKFCQWSQHTAIIITKETATFTAARYRRSWHCDNQLCVIRLPESLNLLTSQHGCNEWHRSGNFRPFSVRNQVTDAPGRSGTCRCRVAREKSMTSYRESRTATVETAHMAPLFTHQRTPPQKGGQYASSGIFMNDLNVAAGLTRRSIPLGEDTAARVKSALSRFIT